MTAISGRTTYRDLTNLAARQVATAATSLTSERFADVTSARANLEAYWRLLGAIHGHAWQLVGGTRRVEGITASTTPEPADRAAVRFIDTLARAAHHSPDRDRAGATDGAGASWLSAARALGAANDLLASHRDPHGQLRSPDGVLLEDPRFRAAGYAALADLAITVAAADRDLALRSGQAGVPWREVARRLPDLEDMASTARDLARESTLATGGRTLDADLATARPGVRTGDPVIELSDRIDRLRQNAWQLTHQPRVGVDCLTEYAAVAVIVHTHVAAHLAIEAASQGQEPPVHSMARRARDARAGWAQIHMELRELRTATPGSAALRREVAAVRDLCQTVLPIHRDATGVHACGQAREVRALAHDTVRTFTQIAGWNATVFRDLAASDQIYAPGYRLTGEQVSDSPALVQAKLAGSLVAAPFEEVQQLAQSYDLARAVPDGEDWNLATSADPNQVAVQVARSS
jgi:hypothetical protein